MSAYRLRATHLDCRLGEKDHEVAAFGGLQDSLPRAGLLALHARMEGVWPGSWQEPRLVQLWFRWADYLVPRRDVGVFTLGCSPRDREHRAALERLADAVVAALDGRALPYEELADACPALTDRLALRPLAVTGKIHIRWDARTLTIVPADPAEIDEEDARRQLLGRFLHWLGPSTAAGFARWAGLNRTEAELTWDAVRSELIAVSPASRAGWILAEDEDAFTHPSPPTATGQVRLLPPGDPYLYLHAGLRIPGVPRAVTDRYRRPDLAPRLANSLTGRILNAGRITGSWGRAGSNVTFAPWQRLTDDERNLVIAETARLDSTLGQPVRSTWIE